MPQGGLKVVLRSLLDMGYDVGFAQLQAGDYGTPQTRVRFYLIAAKSGRTLPKFPTPTHDFPDVQGMVRRDLSFQVVVSDGKRDVFPINRKHGMAPHRPVTVQDAIGDLPHWNMYVVISSLSN